jgi:hypothetical protein
MRTLPTSSTRGQARNSGTRLRPISPIPCAGDDPIFPSTPNASATLGLRAILPAALVLFSVLIAACAPCRAQVEEAQLVTPDFIAHSDIEPSIAGSGIIDPAAANVQAPAPVLFLHNPLRRRGPLWHTADVEGGQTSIRPTLSYEQCRCFSADGGNGEFVYHLTDRFGLAADGSRFSAGSPDQPVNMTSYLFGPPASFLVGRHILPYGHVLLGKTDLEGQTLQGKPLSTSSFALGCGAGVDLVLNRDTSLRLAQVDSFVNTLPHALSARQGNIRLTFGVVFRFGR